ncbi:hypothetical protein CcI156_13135 [Frankia sp. CcI156]|nr:hypothetical protein CcI156_13135 [Frankia sp. CcI156]
MDETSSLASPAHCSQDQHTARRTARDPCSCGVDTQVRPFHPDEFIQPAPMDDGSWTFVCEVGGGHPQPGPHRGLATTPQTAG